MKQHSPSIPVPPGPPFLGSMYGTVTYSYHTNQPFMYVNKEWLVNNYPRNLSIEGFFSRKSPVNICKSAGVCPPLSIEFFKNSNRISWGESTLPETNSKSTGSNGWLEPSWQVLGYQGVYCINLDLLLWCSIHRCRVKLRAIQFSRKIHH